MISAGSSAAAMKLPGTSLRRPATTHESRTCRQPGPVFQHAHTTLLYPSPTLHPPHCTSLWLQPNRLQGPQSRDRSRSTRITRPPTCQVLGVATRRGTCGAGVTAKEMPLQATTMSGTP